MTKFSRVLTGAAAAVLSLAAWPAAAEVLTFDDLSGSNFFTANYRGYSFGNNDLQTNPWFYTDQVSPVYVPRSPTHYLSTDASLYNGSLYQATLPISRASPFVFNGAYFSGSDQIGYQLSLNNTVVYTSAPSAQLTDVSRYIPSGYNGQVNSVVIFGHQGYFALDDFTVNAVPEPATWMMLIVGFGLAGVSLRRARHRAENRRSRPVGA